MQGWWKRLTMRNHQPFLSKFDSSAALFLTTNGFHRAWRLDTQYAFQRPRCNIFVAIPGQPSSLVLMKVARHLHGQLSACSNRFFQSPVTDPCNGTLLTVVRPRPGNNRSDTPLRRWHHLPQTATLDQYVNSIELIPDSTSVYHPGRFQAACSAKSLRADCS